VKHNFPQRIKIRMFLANGGIWELKVFLVVRVSPSTMYV
jgi:hypothetical protein